MPGASSQLTYVTLDLTNRRVVAAANFAAVTGWALPSRDAVDFAALAALALERIEAADRDRVRQAAAMLSPDNAIIEFECHLRGDDGQPRRVECIWSGQFDAGGALLRSTVAATCADATDRAREALQHVEARYRSALTAGRMGSWETDYVAMTRVWSAEGMALFGLDLPGGRGRVGGADDEYVAALHPDDRHLAARFRELADRQDSFPAEYRVVRPDGQTLWLSGRGLVVSRLTDGRARRLVSIMADITERKHAEDELRTERERLELAFSAAQMGAYDFDLRGAALWWSPQTYALFGVDPRTFTPTPSAIVERVHPDDRETFTRSRTAAIAARLPLALEYRVLRPDGSVVWLAHRGQAEYDAQGRAVRSFGVLMDVSERKQVEQALRAADREKDNFVATLAHELRNPLAPIRNAVAALAQGGRGDPQLAWCKAVIERQVEQMARLLDDLLDVSRISRGQVTLRRGLLPLQAVFEQAIEVAQPLIEAAGHTLAVSLPDEPATLDGDLTRLAQVFSNLLINAAKYTRPGGRIELVAQAHGERIVVRVRDSGMGIAAEQLPQLFAMFGQLESALDRSQGGLGIGLWLAQQLIELHGGRISASSEGVGRGSEFVVELPRGSEPAALPLPPAQPLPAPHASRRVLVADDLRDSADSLQLLLTAMGHSVVVAYDGEQALQLAEAERPEIVLLDLGMPKLNGYDVCRRIRQQPWGATMLLIAQTGWGQDGDRRRTRDAGFDHHVVKPVDPDALVLLFAAWRAPAGDADAMGAGTARAAGATGATGATGASGASGASGATGS